MMNPKQPKWVLILLLTIGCASNNVVPRLNNDEPKTERAKQSKDTPPITRLMISANFSDRKISAIVQHLEQHQPFKRLILLMPGHPGIMHIESTDKFTLKQNFLILAGSSWLDSETVTAAVDAPTDQWNSFYGSFRKSDRYAEDLRGLVRELESQFGKLQTTIIGTSEGSVSAYHAFQALKQPDTKLVFTSSLYITTQNSHGINSLDMASVTAPVLIVHNERDACKFCPYRDAQSLSKKMNWPLITVKTLESGPGEVCRARSRHQFWGAEAQTAQTILKWIVTGQVSDVTE